MVTLADGTTPVYGPNDADSFAKRDISNMAFDFSWDFV
jgi:hypothetical protein